MEAETPEMKKRKLELEARIREAQEQTREFKRQRLEAEARAREFKRQRLEAEARTREFERQRLEEEARAREMEIYADALTAGSRGTYYSKVADIWIAADAEFSQDSLDAVRRQYKHRFYHQSVNAALGDDLDPAYESGMSEYGSDGSVCDKSCSSFKSNSDDSETTVARKRRLKEINFDGYIRQADIAHLIPHSSSCASFYAPLGEAAAGVHFDATEEEPDMKKQRRMVLIHGQKDEVQSHQGEGSGDERKVLRQQSTGIKHCLSNTAGMIGQKYFLSFKQRLLLIPVLTLRETIDHAKILSKRKYQALVACTDPDAYNSCVWTVKNDICTRADVHKATKTLASFVKAAAHTLVMADESEIEERLRNPQKSKILSTRAEILESCQVTIPKVCHTWKDDTRLAKVTLDMEDPTVHQECDPFLLFVRAAVVWSSIQNQLLLPLPDPHDCEYCLAEGRGQCNCD
eukprot:scaffold1469_cov119-Cylindrotheca_fusiformis.AAC.29